MDADGYYRLRPVQTWEEYRHGIFEYDHSQAKLVTSKKRLKRKEKFKPLRLSLIQATRKHHSNDFATSPEKGNRKLAGADTKIRNIKTTDPTFTSKTG